MGTHLCAALRFLTALTLLQINKVPWYTVENRSANDLRVLPTSITVSEKLEAASRQYAFPWASRIHQGKRLELPSLDPTECGESCNNDCRLECVGTNSSSAANFTRCLLQCKILALNLPEAQRRWIAVPSEDDQNVTFSVEVVGGGFFEELPSLSSDGIMSFRLGAHAFGNAWALWKDAR